MRLKNTIEFLGLWESFNNNSFKGLEFDTFKNEAGGNAFTMSPQKWISSTNAIQSYLIDDVDPEGKKYVFSSEADMLNVALFGKRAWEWRNEHPNASIVKESNF